MAVESAYAIAGDDRKILIAALEWEATRDCYDAWFKSPPRN